MPPVKRLAQIKWFHVTRCLGVLMVVYGIIVDKSGDRGTIILTGAGFMGIDKVARSEPKGG